jgi:hypothetical protein
MIILLLSLCLAGQPLMVQGFFTVFGTVRDEEGRVLSSVRVSLVDENYQPKGTVFADSGGHYKCRNLRASFDQNVYRDGRHVGGRFVLRFTQRFTKTRSKPPCCLTSATPPYPANAISPDRREQILH